MPATIAVQPTDDNAFAKTYRPADFGASGGDWSVTVKRLRGGLSEGVDTIEVNNGGTRFVVLPTRGMGIWKAWRGDLELGWQSPVRGPVHPAWVNVGEPSGLGWLDGFDELFVRCGLESNGAPEFDEKTGRLAYPLHGRIANKPAHSVSIQFNEATRTISVVGVVEETRFHFTKLRMNTTIATQLGTGTITVRDEIHNFSQSEKEIQMLYHVNFGQPLLDGGSRLLVPLKTLVPRNEHSAQGLTGWEHYSAPQPGFAEQVYFMELHANATGGTRTLLKNSHGTHGVSLVFNNKELPCYTVWKNTTGNTDGYVTGLEPGTNFPNPRSFEGKHNRVVKLAANGKTSFTVAMEIHANASELQAAEKEIQALAGNTAPTIFNAPQPTWCA